MGENRPWTIAVVCGASAVGKSSVAVPLAARYGVPLGETDDLITALKAITTSADQPVLHRWDVDPAVRSWTPEQIADLHMSVADVVLPGVRAVIADHLEFGAPVVLEGCYLAPELVTEFGNDVRAVVLHEPDHRRIMANIDAREPTQDGNEFRARVSAEIGRRYAARARAVDVPVLSPWPWANGAARVATALAGAATAVDPM